VKGQQLDVKPIGSRGNRSRYNAAEKKMEGYPSSNGHHPHQNGRRPAEEPAPGNAEARAESTPQPVNPYADALIGTKPREIVEYELSSDPYSNMLPNIASVNAAKTISRGVKARSRGNRVILIVSLIMLILIIVPLILAVFSRLYG
jgi:hypothetical protein